MYRDHICQAPNPDEIEKAVFHYEIRKKAEQTDDVPRLIIQEAQLKLSEDAAIIIPLYSASIRVVQRARRNKNIPPAPKTFVDLIIPHDLQNTVTTQKFLLYDNNDHR